MRELKVSTGPIREKRKEIGSRAQSPLKSARPMDLQTICYFRKQQRALQWSCILLHLILTIQWAGLGPRFQVVDLSPKLGLGQENRNRKLTRAYVG